MMEWQPIETAPKDGHSVFLVWDGDMWHVAKVWWNHKENKAVWFDDDFLVYPTHWMALPSPPPPSQIRAAL
jgi:hypothetical protein